MNPTTQRNASSCILICLTAYGLFPALLHAQIVFDPAIPIAVGTQPDSVATADLNGDGFVDMAVTSDTPDKVSLLFGNGNGTFSAPVNIATGAGTAPGYIVAAHVNADNNIDLIVALKNVDSVLVLRNTGGGVFAMAGTFAVGTEPRQIVADDFDGDGDNDIATANMGSGDVSILLNDGSGAFGTATNVAVGADVRALALINLNGNTVSDLAVTDHDARTVALLTNDGNGGFSVSGALSVGGQVRPDGVAAANLDGDQDTDLVVAASGTGFNRIAVFLNQGGGVFTGPFNYAVGGINPGPVFVADFDCDGDGDVATSNRDSNNVSVLPNAGNGIFGAATLLAVGVEPDGLAAGDFDGMGIDLVTANKGSGNVSVLLNGSSGCAFFCGDAFCDAGEDQCNCPADCGTPPLSEMAGVTCQDGVDNDCDTFIDCADPDCGADPACASFCGDASCDVGEDQCNCPADCGAPPVSEVAGSTCQDGIDNDCDTLTDCADADCSADPACTVGCLNDSECDDGSLCTIDRCTGGSCSNTIAGFGDIAGPAGSCGPDGTVDLQDILAVLDAFSGVSPCNAP